MDRDNGQILFPTGERQRKTILSVVFVILICLVGIGLIALVHRLPQNPFIASLKTTPTPTPDPMAPKNVLLLGYGGAGHDGGLLTDTMIVARIIPKEKKLILISIPRDLWVQVEAKAGETKGFKINAVYAIGTDSRAYPDKPSKYLGGDGGLIMTKDVLEKIIGEPIDFAVAIDFSGFTKLMTTLGGIFIDVPFTFEDKFYPVKGKEKETCGKSEEDIQKVTATLSGTLLEEEFPCRYETIKFEKGKQFMDGETALRFVRSRHSDINGGDFGRSQRQQAFLLGVKNRLLSFAGVTKLIPLFKDGLAMVDTDITIGDVTAMIERYGTISSYTVDSIAITDQTVLTITTSADGQYILVPKTGEEGWGSVATYISDELMKIRNASTSADMNKDEK